MGYLTAIGYFCLGCVDPDVTVGSDRMRQCYLKKQISAPFRPRLIRSQTRVDSDCRLSHTKKFNVAQALHPWLRQSSKTTKNKKNHTCEVPAKPSTCTKSINLKMNVIHLILRLVSSETSLQGTNFVSIRCLAAGLGASGHWVHARLGWVRTYLTQITMICWILCVFVRRNSSLNLKFSLHFEVHI